MKIANQTFNLDEIESPKDLMYSSQDDKDFFQKTTKGQPSHAGFSGTGFDATGTQIPFSLGPHSIKSMRDLLEKSKFTQGNMLEIGFNLGYSARIWLNLCPKMNLTSVDISNKEETLFAAKVVESKFPNRFKFICSDSKNMLSKLEKNFYQLAFIDGDHSEDGIVCDIKNCLELGIKTMIFDDFLPQFGMTIPALTRFDVKNLFVNGNLCLATF